jgi:PadR family transcriptional regulator, regulatory protein AphA
LNTTEFAILGLLAEGPLSGYDIKKEVEERLSHFWSQSYGHIYPMLRRLDERGLVAMTVERQDGRPDRKVYAITDDGRRALEDGFAEPPAPSLPRNELLLRIFMGRHAPKEHLLRDVRENRERAERTLAMLQAIEARLDAEPGRQAERAYWKLTLRYGLRVYRAIADWSREAEAVLEELSEEESEA